MRRLKRRQTPAAPTPPAPTPAAAPAPTPVVATPIPEAAPLATVPKADGSKLPTIAGNEVLARFGGFERPAELKAEGDGVPYLGFYSAKANAAQKVVKALGSVNDGTPFLSIGGDFYLASSFAFLVLAEFPYWCTLGSDFRPEQVWLTAQPFGAKDKNGNAIKEQVESLTMLLPGASPLPEDLAPAVVVTTNWRSVKCPAVKGHLDQVETSMTPEWAKAHGELASAVPPRFRVCSALRITSHTARSGFPYSKASAVTTPATLAQLQAVAAWSTDEDCQAELADVTNAYDRRLEELKALVRA